MKNICCQVPTTIFSSDGDFFPRNVSKKLEKLSFIVSFTSSIKNKRFT